MRTRQYMRSQYYSREHFLGNGLIDSIGSGRWNPETYAQEGHVFVQRVHQSQSLLLFGIGMRPPRPVAGSVVKCVVRTSQANVNVTIAIS